MRSLFMVLALAAPALAQSGKAELFGSVRDTSNLPIEKASILATEQSTKASYVALTSSTGAYHFSALAPGRYQIAATKPGFQRYVRDGVQVRVADRIAIDLTLTVGELTESVEVTAGAPLLQTS